MQERALRSQAFGQAPLPSEIRDLKISLACLSRNQSHVGVAIRSGLSTFTRSNGLHLRSMADVRTSSGEDSVSALVDAEDSMVLQREQGRSLPKAEGV